jgi:hypothetical protein
MSDTKDLLERLDGAEAPDIWSDASTRSVARSPDLDSLPRRSGSRAAATVLAVTISLLAIGAVVVAFWGVHPPVPVLPGSPSAAPSEPPLLGPDLAEALGLKLLDRFPSSGCQFYVEVDNPKGYCLDSVSGTKVDHWVLAEKLQGHVPTEEQVKCFSITDKFGNWQGPTDSPEYRDLPQQFMDQCRPRPEATPSETSPSG